jgi:exodeoxyribonuclease V beta subunit
LTDEILPDDIATFAPPTAVVDDPTLRSAVLPLADMPGGTRVGSFIHAVLEAVDFQADDLAAALTEAISNELARWPVPIGDIGATVAGLQAAIETPLGPLAHEQTLRQLHRSDRLDELTFELPIAGGDHPSGDVTLAAIAEVLADHLPAPHPLHA